MDMFDKAVIAEMALRQSVDHRLSYVPVLYRPTDSAMNHRLATTVTSQSYYRQGVEHRLPCLPALYRPMNFVTLTREAELLALVNHRIAAVASQSAFQLSEQQHQQSLELHQGEISRRISTTPEVQYPRPSVALQETQEHPIKHDGKNNKESPGLHLQGDDTLATKKQVAFSLLDLKKMNTKSHVSLHYPSPKYSGSALLRWAQSKDLQEREAMSGRSIVSLEDLSQDNVALAPAQAFNRSISRTKSNAKKTKDKPTKKRAIGKKYTISNCISIKTVQIEGNCNH
jgi:hypothetical protein